eukprot:9286201-Prorocentrum_lima.AAC.1
MSMLEPSLKDLSELKGRMLSLVVEMEEHKTNTKNTSEFKALKQEFTMMRDTMASDLTVLERTIPNHKEVKGRLMELDGSLLEAKD